MVQTTKSGKLAPGTYQEAIVRAFQSNANNPLTPDEILSMNPELTNRSAFYNSMSVWAKRGGLIRVGETPNPVGKGRGLPRYVLALNGKANAHSPLPKSDRAPGFKYKKRRQNTIPTGQEPIKYSDPGRVYAFTLPLPSGREATVSIDVDVFALSPADRTVIFAMTDMIKSGGR